MFATRRLTSFAPHVSDYLTRRHLHFLYWGAAHPHCEIDRARRFKHRSRLIHYPEKNISRAKLRTPELGEHPLHTSLRSLWTVITIYFLVKGQSAACFEIPIDIPTNFSFLFFSPLSSPFSFSPLLFCLSLYGSLCWPLRSYETWDSAAKGERVNETCSSRCARPHRRLLVLR